MKEQEELIQNKENMLERANLLRKKLKTTKNEVVKCIGEKSVQSTYRIFLILDISEHETYTEKCFESSSCEMRFCLSRSED